jgi:hypothetical protein
VSNRGYTTGFYLKNKGNDSINSEQSYRQTHGLAGTVLQYLPTERKILVELRNRLVAGDETELLLPETTIPLESGKMADEQGNLLAEGHNGYRVRFPVEQEVPVGAVLRRRITNVSPDKR